MIKKIKVGPLTIILCTCERCGNQWSAKKEEPKRCARCRSGYWNKARRKPK